MLALWSEKYFSLREILMQRNYYKHLGERRNMYESLMNNWIILYSDAWFGFVVFGCFFGGEGIAGVLPAMCCVLAN